jgi:hypothetical protein
MGHRFYPERHPHLGPSERTDGSRADGLRAAGLLSRRHAPETLLPKFEVSSEASVTMTPKESNYPMARNRKVKDGVGTSP